MYFSFTCDQYQMSQLTCKSTSSSFGHCADDQGMFTFEKARVEPLHGSRSRVAKNNDQTMDEEEFLSNIIFNSCNLKS